MTDLMAPRAISMPVAAPTAPAPSRRLTGTRSVRPLRVVAVTAAAGSLLAAGALAGGLVGSHTGTLHGRASRDAEVQRLSHAVTVQEARTLTAQHHAQQVTTRIASLRGRADGDSSRALSESARADASKAMLGTCRSALATQVTNVNELLGLLHQDDGFAAVVPLSELRVDDPETTGCLTPAGWTGAQIDVAGQVEWRMARTSRTRASS